MTEFKRENVPRMATIEQASQYTDIAKYRLRQWCKEKRIVCVLCGNRYLINMNKLIEYLDRGDS